MLGLAYRRTGSNPLGGRVPAFDLRYCPHPDPDCIGAIPLPRERGTRVRVCSEVNSVLAGLKIPPCASKRGMDA